MFYYFTALITFTFKPRFKPHTRRQHKKKRISNQKIKIFPVLIPELKKRFHCSRCGMYIFMCMKDIITLCIDIGITIRSRFVVKGIWHIIKGGWVVVYIAYFLLYFMTD